MYLYNVLIYEYFSSQYHLIFIYKYLGVYLNYNWNWFHMEIKAQIVKDRKK